MRRNKHFRVQTATADSKIETKSIPRPSTLTGRAPPVATVNIPLDTLPVLSKGKKGSVVKKGASKKAANRPADSEATQPMATRSMASRAGITLPQTWVVIFFL
jgi:hypothetical protein